jgi:hypothetical protein
LKYKTTIKSRGVNSGAPGELAVPASTSGTRRVNIVTTLICNTTVKFNKLIDLIISAMSWREQVTFDEIMILINPLVSCGHCVVCPMIYGF